MKVGILTFQFAHNYGAQLQAYALRAYLLSKGYEAEIIPYFPGWAQKEYAYSPFASGISIRKRLRFVAQYQKRKVLAEKFTTFERRALGVSEHIINSTGLEQYLNNYDYIIFGSDQIWNDGITGSTADYYGGSTSASRISYAASLGTKELTEWQKKCAEDFLPKFNMISVREPQSKVLLEAIVKKDITTVMDPVFLLDADKWELECESVNIAKPFMFLYFLRDDEHLLDIAVNYAQEKELEIYEVHPTLARFHSSCKRISDAGPREFLWLIKNAECVCSNSFHATSFSVIFKKKLLHIPNASSPERTTSLLERMGYELITNDGSVPLYNLETSNTDRLNKLAKNSKEFLLKALEG